MIRKLCIVTALCIGALLATPAAFAAPPADVCVLDLSAGVPIDHGFNVAPTECAAVVAAVETVVLRTPGGEEDVDAGQVLNHSRLPLDFGISRQRFDPGRADI